MAKTWCQACGERQFIADGSGITCANGHGDAPGLIEGEALALGFDTTRRLRRVIKVEAPKRPTIARRSNEEKELSDSTCTPKWLADLLLELRGEPFDVDPCSNPRSWIHAHWSFSLEKKLDGLRLPWRGSVFKNNPFSAPVLWQAKARRELEIGRCTELVELCKMDPSTNWWPLITEPVVATEAEYWEHKAIVYAPDLWLFKKRVQYDEHPELVEKRRLEVLDGKRNGRKDGKSSNNFCSVLIHHRFDKPALKLQEYATRWIEP